MHLAELRKLLKEYEQSWYLRKIFYGDHFEVIQIRNYLHTFANQPDDYELTDIDTLNLLKIVPAHNDLAIIYQIQNNLRHNYLFQIFTALNQAGLVNEVIFKKVYRLECDGRSLLYSLFCSSPDKNITLTPDILDTVLAISCHEQFSDKPIKKCFRLLDKKNLLGQIALKLLNEKTAHSYSLLKIFQHLDAANCLHLATLSSLLNTQYHAALANILLALTQSKMTLSPPLFHLMCVNKNLYSLVELTSLLTSPTVNCLNQELLSMLLSQDFTFILYLTQTSKLLHEIDMLTECRLYKVCKHHDIHFDMILQLLSTKALAKYNINLIDTLLDQEIKSHHLYKAISYLNSCDLLNQESLVFTWKLMHAQSRASFLDSNIFDIFIMLNNAKIYISLDTYASIKSLNNKNMKRLEIILSDLVGVKLLDHDSLKKALHLITGKLPHIPESIFQKNSRKLSGAPRSELILDNTHHFYREHSSLYEYGGFGIIKKGYHAIDSKTPVCSIKKLKNSTLAESRQMAMREARIHRLLGRNAFYFTHKNKTTVIADWQHDKSLDQFKPDELIHETYENRLYCLATGLADLNILHQHYRLHGDIKCQNFILDLNKHTMKLIDFGSSHKKDSSQSYGQTTAYLDPHTHGDRFPKDIYAMGIVTMHLFPELYTVILDQGRPIISKNKTALTIKDQAIVNLVDAMMNPVSRARCTSEDAFKYCRELAAVINLIDDITLQAISSSSIKHKEITVEDVFRGHLST